MVCARTVPKFARNANASILKNLADRRSITATVALPVCNISLHSAVLCSSISCQSLARGLSNRDISPSSPLRQDAPPPSGHLRIAWSSPSNRLSINLYEIRLYAPRLRVLQILGNCQRCATGVGGPSSRICSVALPRATRFRRSTVGGGTPTLQIIRM